MASRLAKFKKPVKRPAPDDNIDDSLVSAAVAATSIPESNTTPSSSRSRSTPTPSLRSSGSTSETQYNYEAYREELESLLPSFTNDELKFAQNGYTTQLSLKQICSIQSEIFDSCFAPPQIPAYDLEEAVKLNKHGFFSTDFYNALPDITLEKLDPRTFHTFFKLMNSVTFAFNDAQMEKLPAKHQLTFPFNEKSLRNGIVYNMGGLPLTLEWCPLIIEGKKFLFVSVVDLGSDIKEFTDRPSCLAIFEFTNDKGLILNKQIYIDSVIKEMKFSLICKESENEKTALLTLVLSSGSIEIMKVNGKMLLDNADGKYYKIQSGVRNWKPANQALKITSISYVTTNVLIFVTNHGQIGQYSIEENRLDYMISLRLPSLLSVKTSIPVDNNELYITACISCSNFEQYTVRLPLPSTNSKFPLMNNVRTIAAVLSCKDFSYERTYVYLYNLKSFLCLDGNLTIKNCPISSPLSGTKYKIQSDNHITCIANDVVYQNGLIQNGVRVISGHSNGSVRLFNILEFMLNSDRKNSPSSIKLFRLHRATLDKNSYWLDLSYEVDKTGELPITEKVKRNKYIPHTETSPTKISMMGNTTATAYGGGLIVVEDLLL